MNENSAQDSYQSGHTNAVKKLLKSSLVGTLSTHSARHHDYPFGSMMPYALDHDDRPIFLISKLAVHTQNIINNPKASLFVAEQTTHHDPLATARVTFMGELSAVDSDEIRSCYLKIHPDAQQWVDFADFSFYRMNITAIYFVAGFGKMSWINMDEYATASDT